MKTTLLTLTLLVSLSTVLASGLLPILRPRIGGGRMGIDNQGLGFFQMGLMFTPYNTPIFLAIDDNIHTQTSKEIWPGVSSYKFRNTFNIFGFSIGINFLRLHKLNFQLGLKLQQVEMWGKLISSNSWIQSNVSNSYYYHKGGLSPYGGLCFQARNNISFYLNCQSIHIQRSEVRWLIGFGAAYTIISEYRP